MKPKARPLAMEYVNGMTRAVSAAGVASDTSFQSMSISSRIISPATYSSAGAVA
ncbi:Uncharacterised protein [Bordetella pertussis]|nr:Uncharacterised protein [Bordetella pertussis]